MLDALASSLIQADTSFFCWLVGFNCSLGHFRVPRTISSRHCERSTNNTCHFQFAQPSGPSNFSTCSFVKSPDNDIFALFVEKLVHVTALGAQHFSNTHFPGALQAVWAHNLLRFSQQTKVNIQSEVAKCLLRTKRVLQRAVTYSKASQAKVRIGALNLTYIMLLRWSNT